MAKGNVNEFYYHKGKALIIAGLVTLVAGVLRFYKIDWSIVLMVIGAILLIKGMIIKSAKKKHI